MMASQMIAGEFVGFTLTEENNVFVWDPMARNLWDQQKLVLRHALLGVEAEMDGCHTVTAFTDRPESKPLVIAVLELPTGRSQNMDFSFGVERVEFKLTNGTGPVHIHGNICHPNMFMQYFEYYFRDVEPGTPVDKALRMKRMI